MSVGKATVILAIVLAVYVFDIAEAQENLSALPEAMWNEFSHRISNLTAPLVENLQSTMNNLVAILQSNPQPAPATA